MKSTALVLSGIAIGGLLGAVFTSRVSAQPRLDSPMRFENVCEAAGNVPEVNKLGARRGEAGFELVSFANGVACFKREIRAGGPVATTPARAPVPDTSWPGY